MRMSENEFNDLVDHATAEQVVLPETSLLETIVGDQLDYDYALKNNDTLTSNNQGLLTLYGYSDFYSLYLASKADFATYEGKAYSRDKEASKSASKNKDVSRLRLVQRTVMRRGKPTTLSFYEDPNKGEKKTNADGAEQSGGEQPTTEADFTGFYLAGTTFGKPKPEGIAQAAIPEEWYTAGNVSGKMFDYMFFVTGSTFETVTGIKKNDKQLTISFVATKDKDSHKLGLYRSIKKLLVLCHDNGYGFYYKPTADDADICKTLFEYLDIGKRGNTYSINNTDKVLGKLLWKK